ncbi:glycine zipper 2TM domain-containing protein [Caenimonas soli]|jgi:uncharacterized protein YcfJ|uniref:glycine zipper 2TM domain-containing protein n=1 Tax=Caenimonas soli TaxID=2735555 RepID=UPI001555C8DB|nr:glycine zipper 2TM domain-containing protein [Caenimonas soli]NPC58696.1 glycine zipper 2TM domain-containing protein [Caenimonas soli]
MKRLAIVGLLAAGAIGAQAESFIDHARVQSVDPQYENVTTPRNECTSQWVSEPRPVVSGGERNYGGAVIGGVAGGILGHQVGKGSGKDVATAVGAVVGALAGDHVANRDRAPQYAQYEQAPREVRQCRTVNDVQTQLTGYRVNYEYRGQVYSTFMRENPGHSLPVRVSVVPVER